MKPEYLDWDSNFFNLRVGRIHLSANEEFSVEHFNNFDLVYIIVENGLTGLKKKSIEAVAFPVDEKLTYEKTVSATLPLSRNIFSWPPSKPASDELLEIAVQAGEFSRFKADPAIDEKKFIELYQLWVINSVNRKIAGEVYCFDDNGQVAGLITLGLKNNIPDIGILSVHKKFRGKGVATALTRAGEYWAKNVQGCDQLQVVTQAATKIACSFYEKLGFNLKKREFIFHWWKNANKS